MSDYDKLVKHITSYLDGVADKDLPGAENILNDVVRCAIYDRRQTSVSVYLMDKLVKTIRNAARRNKLQISSIQDRTMSMQFRIWIGKSMRVASWKEPHYATFNFYYNGDALTFGVDLSNRSVDINLSLSDPHLEEKINKCVAAINGMPAIDLEDSKYDKPILTKMKKLKKEIEANDGK